VVSGPAEVAAALLRAHVEDTGCELYDLLWAPGLLRVLVDRDGGVDLNTITALSRKLSAALDAADPDPLPGRYTLEVSSPGLERKLRTPAHYQRFVGTPVSVKLTAGAAADADRRFQAPLEEAETVFEWGPAPKPGGRPPKTHKKAKVQP
jgi:ribosome maturation factor RimP